MAANLLQLQGASKSYGVKGLFQDASFSINEGEHVGVIGPNGAGKSTLFRVITGEEELDQGSLVTTRGLRLGYLPQHDDWVPGESLDSYVCRDAVKEPWDLRSLGSGLGLEDSFFEQPIESLSGGYRMRAKLLKLIGQEPQLMLLDEPTNYLDLETLLVLENFLIDYKNSFLLISHDREFLRRTTTYTLEVEGGDVMKFNGGIEEYFEQKQMLREQLQARAMTLAQKRAEILDFVARFGAQASKASQAQSRLKRLSKMETVNIKPLPVAARIKIPEPPRCPKVLIEAKSCEFGYPEKKVIVSFDFILSRGAHVAVVGHNGAGKSTLLKSLAERIPRLSGEMSRAESIGKAFYAQHVCDDLDLNLTVIDELHSAAHPDCNNQDVLDMAGSLLFSGDDVRKKIKVLSGGERSRVALGKILLMRAPCLFLDEPTNHLDFYTVEALAEALKAYMGAFVLVSHDRTFMARVATSVLEVKGCRALVYPGTYEEYLWSVESGQYQTLAGQGDAASKSNSEEVSSSKGQSLSKNFKKADRIRQKQAEARERQIQKLLVDIETIQKRIEQASSQLPTLPVSEHGVVLRNLEELQNELESKESLWGQLEDEKRSN